MSTPSVSPAPYRVVLTCRRTRRVLQVIATGLTRPQASALAAARRAARAPEDEHTYTVSVTLAPLAEQARLTTADALAA